MTRAEFEAVIHDTIEWESPCPESSDQKHCEHWYDTKPCCACGAPADDRTPEQAIVDLLWPVVEAATKLHKIAEHLSLEIVNLPGDDEWTDQHMADLREAIDLTEKALASLQPAGRREG